MRYLARLTCIACALAVSLPAVPAEARNEEARAKFESAQRAYRVGSFQEALVQYEEAYRLDPRPPFLFNIGQCHRQMGNWERAIFFFNQYLDAHKEKAPKNKALVTDLIRECEREQKAKEKADAAKQKAEQERLAKQRQQEQPAVPVVRAVEAFVADSPSQPVEPKPPVVAVNEPVPAAALAPAPIAEATVETEKPVWKRWWFWTAVGAVAAGAVAGGVYVATTPEPQPTTLGTRDLR